MFTNIFLVMFFITWLLVTVVSYFYQKKEKEKQKEEFKEMTDKIDKSCEEMKRTGELLRSKNKREHASPVSMPRKK